MLNENEYEFFSSMNIWQINIEETEKNVYSVWHYDLCVDEGLSLRRALDIANSILNEEMENNVA